MAVSTVATVTDRSKALCSKKGLSATGKGGLAPNDGSRPIGLPRRYTSFL